MSGVSSERWFRHLQLALGTLWIGDGLLQLQYANLEPSFAAAIAGGAMGQRPWAASLVTGIASIFRSQPLAADLGVAAIRIVLGLAIVLPRTRRIGLLASIPWAIGVWVLGEGLGNLATGFAMLPERRPGPGPRLRRGRARARATPAGGSRPAAVGARRVQMAGTTVRREPWCPRRTRRRDRLGRALGRRSAAPRCRSSYCLRSRSGRITDQSTEARAVRQHV